MLNRPEATPHWQVFYRSNGRLQVDKTQLVCVTAPTVDELDAAVASIEQAAIQASCDTRRIVGQQAQAFTEAALPLCRSV